MTGGNAPLDVYGWSADSAGCQWYRIRTPLYALTELGRRCSFGRYLPRSSPRVLIGQRVSNPGPSRLWQELSARADRPRLVYELDDDLFHIDPENTKAYAFFSAPEIQANIKANIEAADAVTVSTWALAVAVDEEIPGHPPMHVVPNYLPALPLVTGDDALTNAFAVGDRAVAGQTVIGWAGSGTHSRDWQEHGDQIWRGAQRSGALLSAIGSVPAGMGHRSVRALPWFNSLPDYYAAVARSFDIGVAPLAATLFNRSKSPIKVMEYGALGIPAVASDVGPYADYIEHGVDGFLVRRPHEWAQFLRILVHDLGARQEIAGAAHRKAETMQIDRHIDEWEKAIFGE